MYDFKQIIKNFRAYAEYLPEDVFDKLLELAERFDAESDEKLSPQIKEIIEAIKNGEDVELDDDPEDSTLPDGYIEALIEYGKEDAERLAAEIDKELAAEEQI